MEIRVPFFSRGGGGRPGDDTPVSDVLAAAIHGRSSIPVGL